MNNIEKLLATLKAVRKYGDPDTVEWLESGIARYMSTERESLDICLNLTSTIGQPKQRTRYLKQQRNDFLKQAYNHVNPDKSDLKRCEILAAHAKDFQARIYPLWKKHGPPNETSQLRKYLFYAADTGEDLLTSGRSIFRILFDV